MNKNSDNNTTSQTHPLPQHGQTPMGVVQPPQGPQQGPRSIPMHGHVKAANDLMGTSKGKHGSLGEPA
jgi:hypothetical protein